MNPDASAPRPAPPPAAARLLETRYSLPALLAELEQERNAGSFAMEKLNQAEIAKMFQNRGKRRAKKA
jgi:hypothetical protein